MRFLLLIMVCLILCGGRGEAQEIKRPSPPVFALMEQADKARIQGQPAEARRLADKALQLARESKDAIGEAVMLIFIGTLFSGSELPKALEYFDQAYTIYEKLGDKNGLGGVWLNRGNAYTRTTQYPKAKESYEKALPLFREVGNRTGEANVRLSLGSIGVRTGNIQAALPHIQAARELFRQEKDRQSEARVLLTLGAAYGQLNDVPNAMTHFQQAATLAREVGNKRVEANAQYNLGVLQINQGYTRPAEEAIRAALPFYEASGQLNGVADCQFSLGQIYALTGALFEALEQFEKALALYRQMGDQQGVAKTLGDVALLYTDIGQRPQAQARYTEALRIVREIGDQLTEGTLLHNLGELYVDGEQYREALACFQQALRINRAIGIQRSEAYDLLSLSAEQARLGELAQAVTGCQQALALFQQMNNPLGETVALTELARWFTLQGRLPQALEANQQALKLAQEIGEPALQMKALTGRGIIQELQKNPQAAAQSYRQALTHAENVRASLGNLTESKIKYQEVRAEVYHRYLSLLLATRRETEAFGWVQRSKARALTDLLATGKADVSGLLTPQDRTEEERLRTRDREVNREWLDAVTEWSSQRGQAVGAEQRQKAEQRLRTLQERQRLLERDWSLLRDRLTLRTPRLALQRPAEPASLAEVAQNLPEDTALLEYLFLRIPQGKTTRESLALFVITRENGKPRLQVYRLPTEGKTIATLVRDLRLACAGRPGTTEERPYQNLARQLYRLLLAPAEAAFVGKKRLILCPDGPLWEAPFQVLLIPSESAGAKKGREGGFLWERYRLTYAYSATGFKAVQGAFARTSPPSQALLVMASPDFGVLEEAASPPQASGKKSPLLSYASRGGLAPLPNTRREANAIRASFPSATLKLGREAQEEVFKKTASQYRYLHLATHGFVNDTAPMMSGIALARPEPGSQEDGFLTARELFGLSLNAEMAVLSACETARGTQRGGEGVIGLTWALLAAGVKTQVVSQWSVDDEATSLLMKHFYGALQGGQRKDEALRVAALTLLRDGKHSHPFFWAPFLLMGNGQ